MVTTTETNEQVTELYVGLFGRIPDKDGLVYWVKQLDEGTLLTQVAQDMFSCEPAREYYPLSMNNEQIVGSFYTNVLGRTAETAGLDYWTAKLDAGESEGTVILQMINAVKAYASNGTDEISIAGRTSQALFNNKVEFGLWYAVDRGGNNNDQAADAFVLITSDPASVAAAEASIIAVAETFTLVADAPRITEGDFGGQSLTYTLTLDKVPTEIVVIDYQTLTTGTAMQGTDFNAVSGTVIFTPGQTVAIVSVLVYGDTSYENDETVKIMFSGAALTADVTAIGTIENNDAQPVAPVVLPKTFALTTGVDNFAGGTANDIFNGSYDAGVATDTFGFGGTDILAGKGGIDTLNINHIIDVAITPPDALWGGITGIEKVVINTSGNGAQTITTGANFEAAFATAGVGLTTTTLGSGAINIDMTTVPFTGAATITTESLAGAQVITTGSGAATVDASSDAGALTIKGVGLVSVTALTTGAGAQVIGDAGGNGAHLVAVNAQSDSGAQTITSTSTSNVTVTANSTSGLQTIVTGDGNDTVTTTAAVATTNVITTNAGNDTIVAGAGTDLITGGLGADIMTGGGGIDTFVFGANGSVIGTSRDIILDFNSGGAQDVLTFDAATSVLAADVTALFAGSGLGANVQTSAGGLITFAAADNNLALKIAAVQADVQLDVAGSIAMFVDGSNTYVYYAGIAPGDVDDQLIQLTGIVSLATITSTGATITIV